MFIDIRLRSKTHIHYAQPNWPIQTTHFKIEFGGGGEKRGIITMSRFDDFNKL
jgi:hypothetical protein